MRLLFVVILVGTTIQALTERSREQFRLTRWRSRMKDHVVVCGFGTKGRNAIRALTLKGCPPERIVVVDDDARALDQAAAAGFVTVGGRATGTAVLREALVQRAKVVVVALGRDDTAVLVTLAARRLNPDVTVVAAVREAENGELLRQSGATSVIVSSETAGRLLGMAADSPDTVEVVEDLLSFGSGLDLNEREVLPDEVGRSAHELVPPVLAVLRGRSRLYYDDPQAHVLQPGDRLVHAEIPDGGATLHET
jgi:voltage-gated potassium channel